MAWWHVTEDLYESDDLVHPGSWGRRVLGVGPGHTQYFRELHVDRIRAAEFADRPSRLSSCFVFEDVSHVEAFRQQQRSTGSGAAYWSGGSTSPRSSGFPSRYVELLGI